MSDTTTTERFLRVRDVKAKVGMAESTIYAKVKKGEFPEPISLGPNTRAWIESDITAWMREKIDAHRAASALPRESAASR